MSSGANVHSIQALADFKGALANFKAEARAALDAAAQEIMRTTDWLEGRLRYWQAEVQRKQQEAARAEAALAACQRSGTYDREGHYHPPNCSRHESAVLKAKQALREAQTELQKAQHWVSVVKQAVADYQRQAQRLSAIVGQDLDRAGALLGRKIAILESYATLSAPSGNELPQSESAGANDITDLDPSSSETLSTSQKIGKAVAITVLAAEVAANAMGLTHRTAAEQYNHNEQQRQEQREQQMAEVRKAEEEQKRKGEQIGKP
ncbi:MAG: hypothetical protein HY258_10765 [Chloroflexi bacterium]|nr:hypothetical protein [Chloroflexota bacterium]